MAVTAEWVPFGRPALERLAEVVAACKGGDALAPVTVIVPSNPVGVWARRALGGRPGGVANVEFTTIDRLTHDHGAPALAATGRMLLTDQARAAAVRRILAGHTGSLAAVRSHPSTARAVADTVEVVRRAGPSAAPLRRSSRALVRDVLEVGEQLIMATSHYYDEVDLARVAMAIRLDHPVVVHLPEWWFPARRDVLGAIARAGDVRLLLGATGDPALDREALGWVGSLGVALDPPSFPIATPTEQRSVPDADDEARHAVRWLLARRAEGTPFHRMAVCYTAAVPYRRALHRHLEAAGIVSNGPSMVTVGETIAGRFVRAALGLVGSRLRRDEVMHLVSAGPLQGPDGVVVRPTLWDKLSRDAGVVAGLDQWRTRLGDLRGRRLAGEVEEGSRRARDAEMCDDVVTFVETLAADLERAESCEGWAGHVTWLRDLIDTYLPSAGGRTGWPELEQEATERLILTIELLAGLDELEPSPEWASFVAAVEVELERPTQRTGHLGEGVLVGPLAVAVGADLDAIAVVGAIEGLLPRSGRGGVILGAAEHDAVGPDLGDDTRGAQHRRYLAALASSSGPRLCLSARGDLRRGRDHYPSRWLADEVHVVSVASYAAGVAGFDGEPAATVAEHDLRTLVGLDDEAAVSSPIIAAVPQLAGGAEAIAARRWGGLSRWNGSIGPGGAGDALERILSATSVEQYGKCPFRFFLSHVLHVGVLDRPEEVVVVDPRSRGGMVHKALEQLMLVRLERGGYRDDEPALLQDLLEAQFTELEGEGRSGEALHWELERERIQAQAATFFRLDAEVRHAGAVVEAAEMGFGFADDEPLQVCLPSGATLRFRGSADRVDRMPDGSVSVVDYKTVKDSRKTDDILAGLYNGGYLQLPLYARAARERFGATEASAAYWYLASRSVSRVAEVDLDEVDEWFLEALDVITAGIDDGRFPLRPGEPTNWPRPSFENCAWCDYDPVCPADRDEISQRQCAAPELETYVELTTRVLPVDGGES